LRFGEEYGSTVTQYLNITAKTSLWVVPMAFSWKDWQTPSISSYMMTSSSSSWLTASPNSVTSKTKIGTSENAWLYLLNNQSSTTNVYQMRITTFDASFNQIAEYLISNDYSANSVTAYKYLKFPTGTYNLNNISAGKFISGAQPIISASVYSYRITVLNNGGSARSAHYYYEIDYNACTNYDSYRVHFLNKLGGFDSHTFNLASTLNTNIERKNFKKITGSLSGVTWGYNKYDRTITPYEIKYNDTVTLTSNWISSDQMTWLKELFTSPQIYIDTDNTTLIHATVVDTTFNERQVENERLINCTITLAYGQDNFRQSL
jgi:hypothetical protein